MVGRTIVGFIYNKLNQLTTNFISSDLCYIFIKFTIKYHIMKAVLMLLLGSLQLGNTYHTQPEVTSQEGQLFDVISYTMHVDVDNLII